MKKYHLHILLEIVQNEENAKYPTGKHPTGLHGFKFSSKKADGNKSSTDDDKTVKSNCAYVGDSHNNHTCDPTVLSMCVVPVRIQNEKSNKEVISFAMLDAYSQGTFSTNKLMKDLGIEGTRTSINIKMLNGQERQSTYILDGIKVCRLTPEADKYQKWIKLPSAYTKEEIPVDKNEITTPAKLKQWQYLEKISSFLGVNDNISVDLLIGANCVEALQPLEVIPSQQEGPYAYKTILGWCVVGPIVDEKQEAVSSNRIAVFQAGNRSVAKHHFEVQNKCEDIVIKEMLRKIYASDFQDTSSQREDSIIGKMSGISNEDGRFLKILGTETVKVANHYQTPLSFEESICQTTKKQKGS